MPTASPTVSSTVGLKNMVIAPLTADTDATHTYGTLQLVAGAIEASITPENSDPDVQYADDVEFSVLNPDPNITFKTKMADIPLAIQEMIFGNVLDSNGVLVRAAGDASPYFAVGFKSEKSNGKYRYVWLLKVRAKPITESYATKEGTTMTRQTGEVEWTAIKRTHDGMYQVVADEGENGFTVGSAATFLDSVYEPNIGNTLSALTIGSLTLSPTFNSAVTSYTATATGASDTITATASAVGATVVIKNGETTVTSGSTATWVTGANIVTVSVTNGSHTKTYTVTVTKS